MKVMAQSYAITPKLSLKNSSIIRLFTASLNLIMSVYFVFVKAIFFLLFYSQRTRLRPVDEYGPHPARICS